MIAPAVTVLSLSPDELAALLRDVVRAELADARSAIAAPPSQRLTIDALAHAEGCSRSMIRRLMREPGAPVHYVGASPRFDLAEWRAWCATRGRAAAPAAPRSTPIAGVRLLSRGRR
jgi:hypothetical protein